MLGTGMVGRAIGTKLVGLGHEVSMGSRTAANENATAWADSAGKGAAHGTYADAASFGELVINCTAGAGSLDALRSAGADHLAGKVLIDLANPLDYSRGFPPSLTFGSTDSLGEQIQRVFPEAKVVKTMNTMNHEVALSPARVPGEHVVFLSGNDDGAKDIGRCAARELRMAARADRRPRRHHDVARRGGVPPAVDEAARRHQRRVLQHRHRPVTRAGARGQGQNRTADTAVFSRVLCQLSYLARWI